MQVLAHLLRPFGGHSIYFSGLEWHHNCLWNSWRSLAAMSRLKRNYRLGGAMKKVSLLFASLLLATGMLRASVISYATRDAFYAAVPGTTIEGWDEYANGTLLTDAN